MAALMREAIFAQHNVALTPTLAVRHRFGIRLIRALCACLAISEHSAQHAMLLWTMSVSMSARGGNLDVCVACLMVCTKMHETTGGFGMSRFVTACKHMFTAREQTARALEWTVQQDQALFETKIHYLTAVLKMFEYTDLTREVERLSRLHIKHAEIFLLFTGLRGQWYRYLIELYEYVLSKTQGMSTSARTAVILEVCDAQDA
jgi:hypothetical protein